MSVLAEEIQEYSPNMLFITWCHSRTGYTATELAKRGVFSQIILQNDLYLLTGKREIKLSTEQKKMIEDSRSKITKTGPNKSLLVHLSGAAGTGKTVLGLEIGRMLSSHRCTQQKRVQLMVCMTDGGKHLLDTLQTSLYKTHRPDSTRFVTPIGLFEELWGRKYKHTADDHRTLYTEMTGKLSMAAGDRHTVLVWDEWNGYNDTDWSAWARHDNVDCVVMQKPRTPGYEHLDTRTPESGEDVLSLKMNKPFRQSRQCVQALRYMNTHALGGALVRDEEADREEEERCPPGQSTIWVECGRGVSDREALVEVKKRLEEDRKQEEDRDQVTVLYQDRDEECNRFCKDNEWKYVNMHLIHGSEAEVVVIMDRGRDINKLTYPEVWSRARRRTVLVTRPGTEEQQSGPKRPKLSPSVSTDTSDSDTSDRRMKVAAALSAWTDHSDIGRCVTFAPRACPFEGRMMEIVKIHLP
eukprot:GFUD01042755.1.p1 GENE.GFUD01042755.1~~GFUD01042755.1.p1  ORF type:complete len:468 (+),score=119.21 GFUD01042755.1:60-1463(+)